MHLMNLSSITTVIFIVNRSGLYGLAGIADGCRHLAERRRPAGGGHKQALSTSAQWASASAAKVVGRACTAVFSVAWLSRALRSERRWITDWTLEEGI